MNIARTLRMHERRERCDDGFTLIEVVVALSLIVVVMTSTAAFFVRGLTATRLMQQRQAAVAVAVQAMERARAVPPAGLVVGSDTILTGADDPSYRVGNINYRVSTVVAECWQPRGSGASLTCAADAAPPNMLMYRITVDVRWHPRSGTGCAGAGGVCEYTVSTLRDPALSSTTSVKEIPTP